MPWTIVDCESDEEPWQQHWGGPAAWVGMLGFWRRTYWLGTGRDIATHWVSPWTWVPLEDDPA